MTQSIYQLAADMTREDKVAILSDQMAACNFAGGGRAIACGIANDGLADPAPSPRGWRREDFTGQSVPKFRCNIIAGRELVTPAGWIEFENSTSFSGEYLLAQVLRFRATGEPEALRQAGWALNSIRAISKLTEDIGQFGWLCKPFEGRPSPESSPDQNLCAVAGMYAYRPYAQPEEKQFIEAVIPAIADHWRKIDYTIDFGDHVWNLVDDIAHMRVFAMINHLAYRLSGAARFRAEAERLDDRYSEPSGDCASLFDTFRRYRGDYFADYRHVQEFAGATLLFVPLALNILIDLYPEKRTAYLDGWKRALEHGLIGLDLRHLGHWFNIEVRFRDGNYHWRRMHSDTTIAPEAYIRVKRGESYGLEAYHPAIIWQDGAARFPLAYALYRLHGGPPIESVAAICDGIWRKLDFTMIHGMIDYDDALIAELSFLKRQLTSEMACYPGAFYAETLFSKGC